MDEQKQKDEELGEDLGDIFKEDFYEEEIIEDTRAKSLHKVKNNSMIAGVCTGIGKYFGVEPVIIRVLFVISIFIGGWGIVAYLLAAVLMPSEIIVEESNQELPDNNYAKTIAGTLFVLTGCFFIADNFGFLNNLFFFGVSKYFIVPLLLVSSGIFILVKSNILKPMKSSIRKTKFLRSKKDRRLFGVCGGLADYLNIESNNLRMLWIIFSFITIGTGLVLYLFIAAITQTESDIQFEIQ